MLAFPSPWLSPSAQCSRTPSSWSLCCAVLQPAFADLQEAPHQHHPLPPNWNLDGKVTPQQPARARLASIRTSHCSTSTHCTAGRGERGGGEGRWMETCSAAHPCRTCASAAHTAPSPNYRPPRSKPNHHINPTTTTTATVIRSAPSSPLPEPPKP